MSQEPSSEEDSEPDDDHVVLKHAMMSESTSAVKPVQEAIVAEESDDDEQITDTSREAFEELIPLIENLRKTAESFGIELEDIVDPELRQSLTDINENAPAQSESEVSFDDDHQAILNDVFDGDRIQAMRTLLEKHNLRLIQQLLASDTGALSPKEVSWRNKDHISESTVYDHLSNLEDKGFVEKLEQSGPPDMPSTYYAATPFTITLLKQMGLWENLGILYQVYDAMERPEEIEEIENWDERPKPDWLQS